MSPLAPKSQTRDSGWLSGFSSLEGLQAPQNSILDIISFPLPLVFRERLHSATEEKVGEEIGEGI